MKITLKLLAGIMLVAGVMTSCDKKDDEPKDEVKTNYLMIGENEYTLSAGVTENYGMSDDDDWDHEGYNLDLWLVSDEITVEDEDGEAIPKGVGELIYFEMFTSTSDYLDEEVYTLNETSLALHTFDYGSYVINYDVDSDDESEEDKWMDLASGTVTVSKSGSEYTIDIDCVDVDGNKVEGNYTGTLMYFDYDETKKSGSITKTKFLKK